MGQETEVRYAIKHGAVFNRPFREVGKEWLCQNRRSRAKISRRDYRQTHHGTLTNIIEGPLNEYIGSVQVHLIGDERWGSYPVWRRGERRRPHGAQTARSWMVTREIAESWWPPSSAAAEGVRHAGHPPEEPTPEQIAEAIAEKLAKPVPYVSDDTIRGEMKVFEPS